MKQYPNMNRLVDLQQLINDFAGVERVFDLGSTNRKEDDVQHSYGLALFCWYLAPKIAPKLDIAQIFKYALAHDIVEVHAGDTFVFAEKEHLGSKKDRESDAITKLYKDWPDFSEMVDFAKKYTEKTDEEARFVKAVDKILPLLVIELGEGKSFWHKHKITLDMEIDNKVSIKTSDYVAPYYDLIIEWLRERDNFYKPPSE